MFGALTDKFQSLFSKLAKNKTLTEEAIADAVKQVRLALLDADVNFKVASALVKKVKEKALGQEKIKSVKAADQFIKIVHEELKALMGGEEGVVNLRENPAIFMLCGLQGSGKTTTAVKLAKYFTNKKFSRKPLLVACDLQRPAAIEQLKALAAKAGIDVFDIPGEKNPVKVAKKALTKSKDYDLLIFDTAGRLHIDDTLMKELGQIKDVIKPHETLFVASASIGQDAVNTAKNFDEKVQISGSILTMLDGSARAGAAISIKEVTGKPLKFEGVGEKIEDLQIFNPHSMADRILGMGDIINLVKKAETHISDEEEEDLKKKLLSASFTFDDYLKQMSGIKKMGPIKNIMKMMPGFQNFKDMDMSDQEFSKMEAMILSMTQKERLGVDEIIPPRRRRIASGSGSTIDDVNRLIKSFKRIKQVMKNMPSFQRKMKKQEKLIPKGSNPAEMLNKLFS